MISVILICLALQDQPYSIQGEEMEGCACNVTCPCPFKNDATFDNCRALHGWTISQGRWGSTDLKDVVFALSVTDTGKNIAEAMGNWKGVLWIDDTASDAQAEAIEKIFADRFGKAFSDLKVRRAPIEMKVEEERRTLKIENVADLRITPVRGANGEVTAIENPSVSVIPKLYCARAETHTYDDGQSKWDFKGQNAFYGPFEYKNPPRQ